MEQLLLDIPSSVTDISVNDVAKTLEVSKSSVRNWIKTGYLESTDGYIISRNSYEKFAKKVVGTDKLNKRANKSNLDDHDHATLQISFLQKINDLSSNELEFVGNEYQEALSYSYRNKEGVYYTPPEIVSSFFEFIESPEKLTFCDPCCGSGNFIIAALKKGFLPENIYGFDIDPVAVEITKARIKNLTGLDSKNITALDFIAKSVEEKTTILDFDVIFTNPPWGKKLDNETRKKIACALHCSQQTDTSAIFLQAALRHAKQNAIIGMLLPEAFFNISSFSETRKLIANYYMLECVDFGKAFKGLLTKAKGVVIKKIPYDITDSNHQVTCKENSKTHFRYQKSFRRNQKYIFNFSCTHEEDKIIQHLYNIEHSTLKENAKWGLGIITGNNDKFILKEPRKDYIPIYKGSDVYPERLATPKNFIPDNLSLYQQVASPEIYNAKEKIIYRFISSNLVFYHDTQKAFFLNSANMFALNDNFPITHKNLTWLMNTKLINWLFKKIFDTHKVLKADIESLPVFHKFFTCGSSISEENFLTYLNIGINSDGTYRIEK